MVAADFAFTAKLMGVDKVLPHPFVTETVYEPLTVALYIESVAPEIITLFFFHCQAVLAAEGDFNVNVSPEQIIGYRLAVTFEEGPT